MKVSATCTCIEILLLTLFSVAIVSMIGASLVGISGASGTLKDIDANWNKDFIMDVREGVAGSCPTNYTPIEYAFGGYIPYYLCNAGGVYSVKPVGGSGCQKVEINATSFKKWKKGTQLCVRREKGLNFKTAGKSLKADHTCPAGEVLCGDTSTKMGLVCIPAIQGKCPVSDILIAAGVPPIGYEVAVASFYDGKSVLVARLGNPLANVVITEAQVCSDFLEGFETISDGRPTVTNYKGLTRQCNGKVDKRYKTIDSTGEYDFHAENLTAQQVELLKNSNFIDNKYIYNLLGRNIIPWKQSCRASMGETNTVNDELHNAYKVQKGIFICALIFCIIVFLFTVLACCSICTKNSCLWQIRTICSAIIMLAFLIVLLCLVVYASSKLNKVKAFVAQECSDATTEGIIDQFGASFKAGFLTIDWIAFGIGLLLFLLFLCVACAHYKRIKEAEENESKGLLANPDFYGQNGGGWFSPSSQGNGTIGYAPGFGPSNTGNLLTEPAYNPNTYSNQPAYGQPAYGQPAYNPNAYNQPAYGQPGYDYGQTYGNNKAAFEGGYY